MVPLRCCCDGRREVVTPRRFERPTYRLGICRSILLSYGVVEARLEKRAPPLNLILAALLNTLDEASGQFTSVSGGSGLEASRCQRPFASSHSIACEGGGTRCSPAARFAAASASARVGNVSAKTSPTL